MTLAGPVRVALNLYCIAVQFPALWCISGVCVGTPGISPTSLAIRLVREEVEQVCHSEHIRRSAYAGRIMVIGRTQAGRTLSVVLDPEGDDAYYVVTARPSSRKERRI